MTHSVAFKSNKQINGQNEKGKKKNAAGIALKRRSKCAWCFSLIKKTPHGGSSACLFLLEYGKTLFVAKAKERLKRLHIWHQWLNSPVIPRLPTWVLDKCSEETFACDLRLPFKFGIAKTGQNHLDYREESNRQKQGYLCKNCKAQGINNIRSEMQVRRWDCRENCYCSIN